MVLSRSKDTMPQTVPSAIFNPPLDYSVFAADYFDLSLLPSPEASINDTELPLSPSTNLYTAPSSPQQCSKPPVYTFLYSPVDSKDDIPEYTPLISTFKEEPYLQFPISPPSSHSSYSNHSSPIYPQSVSPLAPIKSEYTIDLQESLEEYKQLQKQLKPKDTDYQLLREVLKDTSFQKKYNLRPFDFGNITTGFVLDNIKLEDTAAMDVDVKDEGLNGELDQDSIEPVLSLAFEQMQKEVTSTCCVLGISTDPTLWSESDVKAWLLWTTQQFNLPPVQIDYFNMDGQVLASLTEEEFNQRAPQGGCVLYAQLEIWKAACLETEIARASMDSPSLGNPTTAVPMLTPNSPIPVTVNTLQSTISGNDTGASWNPTSNPSSITSSGEISDDDESEASPQSGATSAPTKATSSRGTGGSSHIHLWQFLKELLGSPTLYGSAIRWIDRQKGVFKIEDSVRVARLWGKRKNRPAMNYDKLSRSIRQYYKKGIMKKTERSQRLVYQFCHPYCL